MKIVVTGCAGMIGCYLISELLILYPKNKGHEINHPVFPIGGGQMIYVDRKKKVLIGASDWRKDGLALGV